MMPYKPRTHAQRMKGKRDHREYEGRRMADPRLAAAKRFRNSARWQRFRDGYKRRHPLCCDPLELHGDRVEATAHVHHIAALSEKIELALHEDNCAPLCVGCHAKIEAMVRAGRSTQRLFNKVARPQGMGV